MPRARTIGSVTETGEENYGWAYRKVMEYMARDKEEREPGSS
jgi:hypothetical protein